MKNALAVRLSDKERMIVAFIVRQLEMAYRNASGKPVYAKNMDEVIKSIFGLKKFTKTLEKARRSEAIMIELMKAMDTETLWRICRSREHYRMLCTMVAMDHRIVKLGRKLNEYAGMDAMERPTDKARKVAKELKKLKKLYRESVKTFQDVFDIKRVSGNGRNDAMYDFVSEWLERNDGDEFYDYLDYSFTDSAIDSMDEYIRSKTQGRHDRRQSSREGALGIFGEDSFLDDDEFFGDLDDDLDVDRKDSNRRSRDDGDTAADMLKVVQVISDGFDRLADRLDRLGNDIAANNDAISDLIQNIDEGEVVDAPVVSTYPDYHSPSKMTVDEMVQFTTAVNQRVDAKMAEMNASEATPTEDSADNPPSES